MNNENLKPIRSTEEARAKGRNGGIASGKSRRDRAQLKQRLEILLENKTQEKDDKGRRLTGAELLAVKAFTAAVNGNWKAWELVRDTVGQKSPEKLAAKITAEIDADIEAEIDQMLSDYREGAQ